MTQRFHTSLLATCILSVAVMPVAFAQSPPKAGDVKPVAALSAEAAMTSATPAVPASAAMPAANGKKSWSEVDIDKDGKLTKSEAAVVPALGQVFDQADSNADGSLTADEYKSFVAKGKSGETPKSSP